MSNEQFLSRRQVRDAERAGLNLPPLTQKQIVEMTQEENLQDDVDLEVAVPQIATTGVVNPYAPKITSSKTPVPTLPVASPVVPHSEASSNAGVTASASAVAESAGYDSTLAEAEEPITEQLFAVSPNLNIEPQTASIIIDNFEPLDNISIAISETGEMLKTGSIELPNIATNTGEIATILDAAQVDEAIAQDSIAGFVSTIAPLRASGVVNTAGKIGIMPSRSARNQGGGWLALTLSIVMVTIGGLVLAAFMLGILK